MTHTLRKTPSNLGCMHKFSAWLSCPFRAVGVCALVAFCARHSYAGALALERARGTVWEWRCPPLTHPAIGGRPLPFPGAAVAEDRHQYFPCDRSAPASVSTTLPQRLSNLSTSDSSHVVLFRSPCDRSSVTSVARSLYFLSLRNSYTPRRKQCAFVFSEC